MPSYNYTHGTTSALNRLRFLIGDHRGTNGVATGWLFSDDELTDCLILAGSSAAATVTLGIVAAARIALQCRVSREALAAGVAGTTDTTDRPAAIVNALRYLGSVQYPGATELPTYTAREAEIPGLSGDDTP
jgi:hypothetical protein